MSDIPEGFRSIRMGGPFIAQNGPFYARWTGSKLQLGFRVEQRHTNPIDTCHGGMLATFCDMLMPALAMYQGGNGERRFLPTVNLQIDYLGPAPLGSWVQGEGEVLRRTRNLVFIQALVQADGALALRVSGIFKLGPVIGPAGDGDPLRVQGSGPQ